MEDTVKFSKLSTPLKFFVIVGGISGCIFLLSFMIGFIQGLLEA